MNKQARPELKNSFLYDDGILYFLKSFAKVC